MDKIGKNESLIELVSPVMEGKRPAGPFPVGGGFGLSFSVLYLEGVEEAASDICVPQFIISLPGLYRPLRLKGGVAFPLDTVQSPEDFIGKCLTGLDRAMEQALVVLEKAEEAGLGYPDDVSKAIAAIKGADRGKRKPGPEVPAVVAETARAIRGGRCLPYSMFLHGPLVMRISELHGAKHEHWRVHLVNQTLAEEDSQVIGYIDPSATDEEHTRILMRCLDACKRAARPWAKGLLSEADRMQVVADKAKEKAVNFRRASQDALDYASYCENKVDV